MSTKYIIANISLPLKINDDGTYVVMSESTEIKFSSYEGDILSSRDIDKTVACNELSKLMTSLNMIVPVLRDVESPELNKRANANVKKNITFKSSTKRHYVPSKYTMKNH